MATAPPILTAPQRTLLDWLYRRRNPASFADMKAALKPAAEIQLRKTVASLQPRYLELAPGQDDKPEDAKLYTLNELARELAGNIKAAMAETPRAARPAKSLPARSSRRPRSAMS